MDFEEYRRMRQIEDDYWWYRGFRRIFASLIDRFGSHQAAGRVLDAGCGTGAFLDFMEDRYHPRELTGLDYSSLALDYCRQRGFESLVECSIDSMPFEDSSMDLITSFDVLCHAWIRDDEVPLKEFCRVLAPGGLLLLNLPAFMFLFSRHDRAVQNIRRYRKKEVLEKIAGAGLEPLAVTYTNLLLFLPMAAVKIIRGSGNGAPEEHSSDLFPLPAPLNRALTFLLGLESGLVGRVALPFGTSVTAIARAL